MILPGSVLNDNMIVFRQKHGSYILIVTILQTRKNEIKVLFRHDDTGQKCKLLH